jgi:hypothetical protein
MKIFREERNEKEEAGELQERTKIGKRGLEVDEKLCSSPRNIDLCMLGVGKWAMQENPPPLITISQYAHQHLPAYKRDMDLHLSSYWLNQISRWEFFEIMNGNFWKKKKSEGEEPRNFGDSDAVWNAFKA